MIRTTARFLIKLLETLKIEVVNNSIHDADRVVRSYVFINSLWKKNGLVGDVYKRQALEQVYYPQIEELIAQLRAYACLLYTSRCV